MKALKIVTLLVIIVFFVVATLKLIKFDLPENNNNTTSSNLQGQIIGTQDVNLDIKATWIPYMDLSFIDKNITVQSFTERFNNIVQNCKNQGLNTLYVHIRPFSDSLYPSQFYPWSHLLTGEQGKPLNFDPLAIMINITHQNNMQFHAWINPLRVRNAGSTFELSKDNPYMVYKNDSDSKNDYFVKDVDGGLFYDPAYSEVRGLIIDGVKEIVKNYDVDGIHFDDYFYPTTNESFDKLEYEQYCSNTTSPLDLSSWRCENINLLIKETYSAIKAIKQNVVFGVSPQGNIQNCENMYADVKKWCSESGYVDYICPQIYYSFENATQPFKEVVDSWKELVNEDIDLYCGIALYKAGSDLDEGQWLKTNDIIKNQLEYIQSVGYNGFSLYSYSYLNSEQTQTEMTNAQVFFN